MRKAPGPFSARKKQTAIGAAWDQTRNSNLRAGREPRFCRGSRINTVTLTGEKNLPKDSQPDNKKARLEKCGGKTPITRENQNHTRNTKKQSAKRDDV